MAKEIVKNIIYFFRLCRCFKYLDMAVCKLRDMLCYAHVSEPMNRKVHWDLSLSALKSMCLEIVKYRVYALKINVFWSDLTV